MLIINIIKFGDLDTLDDKLGYPIDIHTSARFASR